MYTASTRTLSYYLADNDEVLESSAVDSAGPPRGATERDLLEPDASLTIE